MKLTAIALFALLASCMKNPTYDAEKNIRHVVRDETTGRRFVLTWDIVDDGRIIELPKEDPK